MVKLTERERLIVHLREDEGLSYQQIADRLGTSKGSVNSSYRNAKLKATRKPTPNAQTVEVKDPVGTAKALDVLTDPFSSLRAAAKECGFPRSTMQQLERRMKARYKPLDEALREVKERELLQLLEDRASRALQYLDDFVMAGASAKDLAITAGVLIDKRQLLLGQPTQILSNTDRKDLEDLMPRLYAEAKRRGITIEGKKSSDGRKKLPETAEG